MIELTWGQIRDQSFQSALQKLMNCPDLDFQPAYSISRIGAKVKTEIADSNDLFVKLVKKHGALDDKDGSYKIDDDKIESWKKEVGEFLDTKFTVDKNKINVTELKKARLSPQDLLAIEPLLFVVESVETK